MKIATACVFLLISIQATATELPSGFLGDWKGPCQTENLRFQMVLNVKLESDSSYQWKTTYELNGTDQVRDYTLVPDATKANSFVLDENNGIKLETYLVGKELQSAFFVGGNLLLSTHKLESGNKMTFRIPILKPKVTGHGVTAFEKTGEQICKLSRVED